MATSLTHSGNFAIFLLFHRTISIRYKIMTPIHQLASNILMVSKRYSFVELRELRP